MNNLLYALLIFTNILMFGSIGICGEPDKPNECDYQFAEMFKDRPVEDITKEAKKYLTKYKETKTRKYHTFDRVEQDISFQVNADHYSYTVIYYICGGEKETTQAKMTFHATIPVVNLAIWTSLEKSEKK